MNGLSKRSIRHLPTAALCAALALFACACAAMSGPDAEGPRAAENYPVRFTADPARTSAATAAWLKITHEQNVENAPQPQWQPVTATVQSLPQLSAPLFLPRVGTVGAMTEEDTRESLRRFITSSSALIGADAQQLSLVRRTDLADGTKKAEYQQRPARYPLRNGYGIFNITFAPDRRISQMQSTCIPDIERVEREFRELTPKSKPEDVIKAIAGRTYTYVDESGARQTITIGTNEAIDACELVIYPHLHAEGVLEFHLAWEIAIGQGTDTRRAYLDAVTEEFIATATGKPPCREDQTGGRPASNPASSKSGP